MERLSNKLLGKILEYVPRRDQLKLFQISKNWNKVMDELVGIHVKLGRGVNTFSSDDEKFDSVKIMEKLGVRSCLFDFFINEATALSKLKHPSLLKFVSCRSFVSTITFEKILKEATNLHTFDIDHLALYHLELFDVNIEIPCEVFNISLSNRWNSGGKMDMDGTKYEILSVHLAHLLRKSFPRLKKTRLYLDLQTGFKDFLTSEVVYFLGNHCKTLTFIDIVMGLGDYYDENKPELQMLQGLPKLSAGTDVRFTQLRKLEVEAASTPLTFYSEKKHWMEWATQIESMEDAYFAFDITQSLLKSIANKNAATLTKLQVYLGSLQGWPYSLIDCKTVQSCKSLKSLTISVSRGRDLYDQLTLYQADLLPKSLVYLKIHMIRVTSDSCKSICLNLPKIQDLMLRRIGSTVDHGVPIEVAAEIISQKKIKQFCLQTRREAQDNPLVEPFRFQWYSHSQGRSNYITCTLGDDGEYMRKYEEDFL